MNSHKQTELNTNRKRAFSLDSPPYTHNEKRCDKEATIAGLVLNELNGAATKKKKKQGSHVAHIWYGLSCKYTTPLKMHVCECDRMLDAYGLL